MLITPLLPYPNFRRSVACYSDDMLKATFQLIVANRGMFSLRSCNLRWEQQDMMRFWRERGQAFIRLGLMCAEESKQREIGFPSSGVRRLTVLKKGKYWLKPLWVGWERLHADHRSILLQYEEVARVRHRIAQRGRGMGTPQDWMSRQGWNDLEGRGGHFIGDVNHFLDTEGFAPLEDNDHPNHYTQFNWAEAHDGEHQVWPPSNGDWYASDN